MRALSPKRKTALALAIHTVIFASTAVTATWGCLYGASSAQDGDSTIGLGYFQPFTMDCNVLAGICSLLLACYAIKSLREHADMTPRWLTYFQLMTTTCLALTLVTVAVFLAPMDAMQGKPYLDMFSGDLFIFHLTNPLLAICAFVFCGHGLPLRRRDCIWGMLPIAVYIAAYVLMVAVLGWWSDFYGFTFGGRYYLAPIVVAVILALACLLGRLLIRTRLSLLAKETS